MAAVSALTGLSGVVVGRVQPVSSLSEAAPPSE